MSADYTRLSERYAGDGDLRMAALAAWAADLGALEALLWENGLGQAPDPGAQLAAVGEQVAAFVEHAAATLPNRPVSLRGVLEAAREAMIATFDESVHGLLSDRLGDVAHLDDAQPADGEDEAVTGERSAARLADRTPEQLAAQLRTAASDCATMATLLGAGGEADAAARLSRQADVAAFEAYLVLAAIRGGDRDLATVDLRWDLVEDGPGAQRRERFAAAVGSAERDALQQVLEPADAP